MAIIGACCGFALNQFREKPLPLVYSPKAERIRHAVAKLAVDTKTTPDPAPEAVTNAHSPLTAAAVHYLGLSEFREIVERTGKAIILDARPEVFHQLGHVPGAISLPRDDFEISYRKQRFLLERDKSKLIAIYCSDSSCEDSQMVANALVKLAYTNVAIFKGGWSDWTQARIPEEKP